MMMKLGLVCLHADGSSITVLVPLKIAVLSHEIMDRHT